MWNKLKECLFPMQITKRIYLWLIVTIVLLTLIFLILLSLSYIKSAENYHKRSILNVATYLGQKSNLSFSEILMREGVLDKPVEEQVAALNKNLQPIVDEASLLYPQMGLGYYSIELDHIVAIAPNFTPRLLIPVPRIYPYFESYKSGKPELGKTKSSIGWNGKPILNVTYPIIHNGKIIGHSWANIKLGNIYI